MPWHWAPSFVAVVVLWVSIWKLTSLTAPQSGPSNAEMGGDEDSAGQTARGTGQAVLARSSQASRVRESALPADVVIDAGHGGVDGGTSGNRIQEKNGTLEIAKVVAEELRTRGISVTMLRDRDIHIPKERRAEISNERPRLAFLSIHLNHGSMARGVETYFAKRRKAQTDDEGHLITTGMDDASGATSEQLANAVHSGVVSATGAADRGVRNGNAFLVLNSTHCPAILIECGFVSDSREAAKLKTLEYQKKIAKGVADGLQAFLGAGR